MANKIFGQQRRKKKPNPAKKYVHKAWPSWRYGPEGQSAIFQGEDEVPEGWTRKRGAADAPKVKAEVVKPGEDPYKGRDNASLIAELKAKKLDFNERWPRDKLIGILKAAEKK